MNMKKCVAAGVLCLLMAVLAVCGLTACYDCAHEWGQWYVTKDVSCTNMGMEERECALCGEIEKKAIEPTGHNYGKWIDAVPAECGSMGHLGHYHCDRCDKDFDAKHKELTNLLVIIEHVWNDATCTTAKTCANCNATEGEPLGHLATCASVGTCVRCGEDYDVIVEHVFDQENAIDTYLKVNATCETKAEYYYSCVCGARGDESFAYGEALGHKYGACSANGNGTHTKVCVYDQTHVLTEDCSGGTATCTDKARCELCNTEYGATPTHKWDNGTVVTAISCTTNGTTKYTCEACHTTKTEITYAVGHVWEGEQDCEHGRYCTVAGCGVTEPSLGHIYTLTSSTSADCDNAASKTYTCGACNDVYTETIGTKLGHNISGVTAKEVQIGTTCEYVLNYECKTCHEDVEGQHVFKHAYTGTITLAATCCSDGVMTYTCSNCGHVNPETKAIPMGESYHVWRPLMVTADDGETQKRTDYCVHCQDTKTVTVFNEGTAKADDASELKGTDLELKLDSAGSGEQENVSINLGNVTDQIDGSITLEAEKLEGDARPELSEEEMEQIKDNPVYNFTINGGAVSEFGDEYVTVTVPYTLEEGEDVDAIFIWFIGSNNKVSAIKAEYNEAGYVTFKTNHFSYYTVTRLTPAQRCEYYGHSYKTTKVAGDCLTDSYELKVCVRCHDTEKNVTKVADGHNYQETVVAATCTTNGKIVYTCADCAHSYEIKQRATGHDITTSVVEATCETNGYTRHSCKNCDYYYDDSIVPASGHDYRTEWKWTTTLNGAQLTFVCSHNADHVFTETAVITKNYTAATCTTGARTEYVAKVVYNGVTYSDVRNSGEGKPLGHKYETTTFVGNCLTDSYELGICERCHETVKTITNVADGHDYQSEVVAPTCETDGYTNYICKDCGHTYKDDIVKATGHDYEVDWNWNGNYKSAKLTLTCTHDKTHKKVKDRVDVVVNVIGTPTCTTGARTEYIATTVIDGVTYTDIKVEDETGKPLGHKLADNMEYDQDKHWSVCTVCNEKVDVADHKFGEGTVTKEATCKNDGAITYTCACGFAKVEIIHATKLHNYNSEWSYDVDGHWHVCTVCGEKSEMIAHEYGEGEVTKEGSCTDGMEITYTCFCGSNYVEEIVGGSTHDATIEKELNLADYGACGGIFKYKTCTCGEVIVFDVDETEDTFDFCDFEYVDEDEGVDENGVPYMMMKMVCKDCGIVVDGYAYVDIDGCYWTINYIYNFSINGETILANATASYVEEEHNTEWTEIDLSKYSSCGGTLEARVCKDCGQIVGIGDLDAGCNGGDLEDIMDVKEFIDENGHQHMVATVDCPDCDLKFVQEMIVEVRSVCEMYRTMKISIYYGDTLIAEDEERSASSGHEYKYTYDIEDGKTCEDGYTVTAHCDKCGDSYTHTNYGHRYTGITVDLSQHTNCGGYIRAYGCEICGMIQNIWDMSIECDGEETGETVVIDGVERERYTLICSECGLKFVMDEWEVQTAACITDYYMFIGIYNGEEVIFEGTANEREEEHNYEYTVIEKGETCEERWKIQATCMDCGDNFENGGIGHWTEHKEIDLAEIGACGGHLYVEYCVICEKTLSINSESMCESSNFDEIDGWAVYTCRDCGLEYRVHNGISEKDENCAVTRTHSVAYFMNGTEICRCDQTWIEKNHNNREIISTTIHGETCEDNGITIRYRCTDCGDEWESYWHGHYTESVRTDLHELGMCEGCYAYQYVCVACGTVTGGGAETYPCQWEFVEKDENGFEISRCRICGTERHYTYTDSEKDENCNFTRTETYQFVLDGSVIYEFTRTQNWNQHDYVYDYVLNGSSCEDGVRITETCRDCAYYNSWGTNSHEVRKVQEYDLTEYGACNGYFELYSCPCGYNAWTNYNFCDGSIWTDNKYLGEDGNMHYVNAWNCETCGLYASRDYYTVKAEDACEQVTYYSWAITVGDAFATTVTYKEKEEAHDFVHTGALMEGATSCEDGVIITNTCKDCGVSDETIYNYHYTLEVNRIDLDQYGSVCHGYAIETACVCGRNHHIDLEHALCDFGEEWCDRWIEDTLTDWQPGVNGDNNVWHNAWIKTCAVTDPEQCGLKIRYAEYFLWDQENCCAIEYETWQFGYDPETDTCKYELTFKTGYTVAYHDYTYSYEEENHIETHTHICSICGSYHKVVETYDENDHCVKREVIAENKANNGGNKYSSVVCEYTYVGNELTAYTEQDKCIYANGDVQINEYERRYEYCNDYQFVMFEKDIYNVGTENEYWYCEEYAEACCETTCTYTNSNGGYKVSDVTRHPVHHWEYSVYPTCSQTGIETVTCGCCGTLFEEHIVEPYDHDWYWDDSEAIYRCYRCGMENINGASGSIIIEDLTEKYGNNENYVLGYYAKNEVQFTYYVSLVLANGEEVILENIEISELDDVCALSFSKTAVQTAASELGYTVDQYDVRFTFVPYGADSSFDYAITFTD